MHDLRAIRRDPAAFGAAMSARAVPSATVEALLAADAARRAAETEAAALQTRRNAVARGVAEARRAGADAAALMEEGREIAAALEGMPARAAALAAEAEEIAAALPNLLLPDVPPGADETGNVVLRTVGEAAMRPWTVPHWDSGPAFGLDPAAGAALAGARFSVLRGPLARLERALGQFMLELHVGAHGYEEVAVPHVVRAEALRGTGQLPKFAEDLFPADEGRFLIPTAEVPLTNLVRGAALDLREPLRMTALTPCYRAEAGSGGRDTRGVLRQHQFHKVELVSVVVPEDAPEEHERMTRCAERVLELLELPHRRVLLCAGDTGFSAAMTFDLEVWMPGQGAWREISSCSTCGDFQARRMGTRMAGRKELPHTLNGSGVAVGRALAALLENHLGEDGALRVPEALRPWVGGAGRIAPVQRQAQA